MSARYSVIDKSLDELLRDLDTEKVQAGAGAFEVANAAIAIKVAKTNQRWTRVAALASVASFLVAVAAVIVEATR